MAQVRDEGSLGERFFEVAREWKAGRLESLLSPGQRIRLQTGDVEELCAIIRGHIEALANPDVMNAVGLHQSELLNAVGQEEWIAAYRVWEEISDALSALPYGEPGFPPWFRECMKLEYEATLQDVRVLRARYEKLSKHGSPKGAFREYASKRLRVGPLPEGSDRSISLAIISYRWGVSPGGVENWLNPAKRVRYVAAHKQSKFIIDLGDHSHVVSGPTRPRGRPSKKPRMHPTISKCSRKNCPL
jgi:hypothetical protein